MKEKSTEKYSDLLKKIGVKKMAVIGNRAGRPVVMPPPSTKSSFEPKPVSVKRGCRGCSRRRRDR